MVCPLLAWLALAAAGAQAQEPTRWVLRGAVSGGTMVSPDQRGRLGYDGLGLGAELEAGYTVLAPLLVEARVAGSYFLREIAGAGGVAEAGVGLRGSLRLFSPAVRAQLAIHVSAAWTGDLVLPSLDLQLGVAFALDDTLAIGPELTYGQVFWTNGPGYSTDARFVMLGAFFEWRPAASPPAPFRVETISSTRVVRVPVERIVHDDTPPPPDPVALDRLLDSALPITHREEVVLIPPILFEFDSTHVLPEGEVALYSARDLIAQMPDPVAIEGHADGRGSDEYNASLSLARAMWVREWLVAHGIDGSRLSVEARGETAPLVTETDAWTRQLDRRVTFRATHVVPPAPPPEEQTP